VFPESLSGPSYALVISKGPQAMNFNRIPPQPWGVWLGRNAQSRVTGVQNTFVISQSPQAMYFARISPPQWGVWLGRKDRAVCHALVFSSSQ
jgi:hypothetical protein